MLTTTSHEAISSCYFNHLDHFARYDHDNGYNCIYVKNNCSLCVNMMKYFLTMVKCDDTAFSYFNLSFSRPFINLNSGNVFKMSCYSVNLKGGFPKHMINDFIQHNEIDVKTHTSKMCCYRALNKQYNEILQHLFTGTDTQCV